MPPPAASARLAEYASLEIFRKTSTAPDHIHAALRFVAFSRWLALEESATAAAPG
jgi:hypothetical protein